MGFNMYLVLENCSKNRRRYVKNLSFLFTNVLNHWKLNIEWFFIPNKNLWKEKEILNKGSGIFKIDS